GPFAAAALKSLPSRVPPPVLGVPSSFGSTSLTASTTQVPLQPSPGVVLPSSHSSSPSLAPLPQMGGRRIDVSQAMQPEAQASVPLAKPCVTQVSLPTSAPSHVSVADLRPSPHTMGPTSTWSV